MFLIYGSENDPAQWLVEQYPASTTPEKEFRVVNGGWWMQEVDRGNRDHLRMSDVHRREDFATSDTFIATLTMEWGPSMTPRDQRMEMLPLGRWDYSDVLAIARQLLAGGPAVTWAERLALEAERRNPAPTDWDPDGIV